MWKSVPPSSSGLPDESPGRGAQANTPRPTRCTPNYLLSTIIAACCGSVWPNRRCRSCRCSSSRTPCRWSCACCRASFPGWTMLLATSSRPCCGPSLSMAAARADAGRPTATKTDRYELAFSFPSSTNVTVQPVASSNDDEERSKTLTETAQHRGRTRSLPHTHDRRGSVRVALAFGHPRVALGGAAGAASRRPAGAGRGRASACPSCPIAT